MKKRILNIFFFILVLQSNVFAQSPYQLGVEKAMSRTKTQQTFNANENQIYIKDYVTLKNGRMIMELCDLKDYNDMKNLDSILKNFICDISFYRDSLADNPTGSVRIDYVLNSEYSFKKIRFKKYNADGSSFLNNNGEISKLKFGQDTVRIVFQKSRQGISKQKNTTCSIPYSMQVTFVIGNYYDVERIVADSILKKVVDTLEKISYSEKRMKYTWAHPLTIIYNPYYYGKNSLKKYNMISDNEYDIYTPANLERRKLLIDGNIGLGLVKNTICPMADIGIEYVRKTGGHSKDYDFYRLSATPYYFFRNDAQGNTIVDDNWFVNFTLGSVYDGNEYTWLGKKACFGFGYLFSQKGDYFKNTTFKLYTELTIVPRVTIVPEIIFTNNSKQIYPGITLKVF